MKVRLLLLAALGLFASHAAAQRIATAVDPYHDWAVSHWGAAVVNDPGQAATVWGPDADPDGDGYTNLQEYAFGTDPALYGSDPVNWDATSPLPGYYALKATVRTNDAALLVYPQYSEDMSLWFPFSPRDSFSYFGNDTSFYKYDEQDAGNGFTTITYLCAIPVGPEAASAHTLFTRLVVERSGAQAIGSTFDAVNFFDTTTGVDGAVVQSNSVTLGGFVGSARVTVSGGAHLIVNGVDVGASALVPVGSTVYVLSAAGAKSANGTVAYTLNIGGISKTWKVVTKPITAPTAVAGNTSGYTPVSASVDGGGAANISLPITVSPGTAGMEPKLAISYSSQGGNGYLGMGFGISGLSAITRAGPVQYLDGIKGGISFGPNDRFAADGQRLVLYTGAWGGDGSEYRTEQESFSRVIAHGATTAGPQSWTMETKAGLKYEYGASGDSRILANRSTVPGDTAVLMWALTRITDNAGNSIEFTYATPDGTESGNPRIVSIAYTRNTAAGLTPGEQVVFSYETRPDVRTSYVAGAKVVMSKRLTAIECQQGGNVARRYEFAYQQAEISGNSQLVSVTERGKQPTHGEPWLTFPPTTFAWQQNSAADMVPVAGNQDPNGLAKMTFASSDFTIQGDFDGDGRMDVIRVGSQGAAGTWLATGQAGGSFAYTSPIKGLENMPAVSQSSGNLRTGDFNGDGKTDLLYIASNAANNWMALSNGDGSFTLLKGDQLGDLKSFALKVGYTQLLVLDLNGDGHSDIVVVYPSDSANLPNRVFLTDGATGKFVEKDPGAAFKALKVSDNNPSYSWILPGDYNGDGLADILHLYYSGAGHWLALSNGDGTFTVRTDAQLGGLANVDFTRDYKGGYTYWITDDFNGDGLTDVANYGNNGYWQMALCKGDGTFETVVRPASLNGLPLGDSQYSHIYAGDFNGDGIGDIVQTYNGHPELNWLALGESDTSFQTLVGSAFAGLYGALYTDPEHYPESRTYVGDFDGDGTDDILDVAYNGTNTLARSNGFSANRVVQVTNGHGGYTKFNYKPMTDPSVYTKGTGAVYPYCDVIGAMYVVSSIVTRNAVDGDAFTVQASPAVVESTATYTYERSLALLDGHGSQGFAAVQSTDVDTGITSRTEYVTGYPNLAGRPAHTVQTLSNGTVISETFNAWTSNPITLPSGTTSYFPYTTSSVTKDYEINNGPGAAPVKTTTVSAQAYDAFGNLTHSLTDHGGGFTEETTSTYTNDTTRWWLGRLAQTTVTQVAPGQTASRQSTFAYSPVNGQLTRETIFTPESNLRLQKDYVHDAFGNITQSTLTDLGTGATRTTRTTYTPAGRFIYQTTNALGQVETKTCDILDGTVLSQTGPNGLTTTWTYDGFGRPLTETRPDHTQTVTQYLRCTPGNGVPPRAVHCVRTQSSGSGPSTVYFDLLDRKIRQDATGFAARTVSTHTVYDVKGETVNASLPFYSSNAQPTAPGGLYATNYFDAIGRVIQQNVPGEGGTTPRVTTTRYAGLTATVTNPKTQTFTTVTDLRGRTVSSTSFGDETVSNTHDPYGNLIKVDDGRGHVTTITYDGRGNKISMVEPNSGTTRYSYNAFGELNMQTDALARVTQFFYDGLGRLVRRIDPANTTIINGVQARGPRVETVWTYDATAHGVGKLTQVTRAADNYQETYRYDVYGRLMATTTQVGALRFVTSTNFDQYSRPDTLCYPNGFAVRYGYGQFGHLVSVYDAVNPALVYWTEVDENARGQVVQERLGNNLSTVRGYDPYTGLIQTIQTGNGGAGGAVTPSVQNLSYAFDNLNNLTQRRDVRRGITENFAYDRTNQLQGITCTAADPITINCDALGNVVSRSDVGTYTYGERGAGPHAVTSIVGADGKVSRTLSYNAVGNCVQDGDTTLEYNGSNQPMAIYAPGGTVLFSYTPGHGKLRRTELVNGVQTDRVYVGSLYEHDDTGGSIAHICFIPAGGGVVAIHTQTQTAAGSTSQTRYVHKDHLGSVQALTDEQGLLTETQDYDAWGRRREFQDGRFSYAGVKSATDRGFTGHEMLDAVGLIHMNGRIYDPTIGRFLSVDPMVQEAGNLQNLNRYCYVLNNPLSLTDPSGFSFLRHFGKFFQTVLKIVAVAVAIIQPEFTLLYEAAIAFGQAFTGTLLAGGSIGDAFRAGAIGGARSFAFDALTAEADFQVGEGFSKGGVFEDVQALKPFVHGAVNGGIASAEGGGFKHGFLAAFTTAALEDVPGMVEANGGGQVGGRVAAAIIGGTASKLGGGKFANGAITAAFLYANNDQKHPDEKGLGLVGKATLWVFQETGLTADDAFATSRFFGNVSNTAGGAAEGMAKDLVDVFTLGLGPDSWGEQAAMGWRRGMNYLFTGSFTDTVDPQSPYYGIGVTTGKTIFRLESLGAGWMAGRPTPIKSDPVDPDWEFHTRNQPTD